MLRYLQQHASLWPARGLLCKMPVKAAATQQPQHSGGRWDGSCRPSATSPRPSSTLSHRLSPALRQMATGGAQSDLARFEQQWFIANGAPPNGAYWNAERGMG